MGSATNDKTTLGIIALTALGASLGAAGCKPAAADIKHKKDDPVVNLETIAVGEREVPRFLTLTGTLVAHQKADVAADTMGKVQRTYVERGSFVGKGELLAIVDARSAALTQAEASAEARAAKVRSEQAKLDCERSGRLYQEGSISKAEYERQGAQCEASQWSNRAAEARAGQAGRAVGDSSIRAPFAGIVMERLVTAGEYVRPDTRVVSLVDIDKLRLELSVPEAAVGSVTEGQTVSFRLASFGDREFPAKIQYVGPAVRRSSRDLVVEAVLDNADHKLRPGMFAQARVELGTASTPVVPRTALREEGSARRVFVVNREKHLEERIVEAGDQMGDVVAIVRGVASGERVVKVAASDVRDGLRVE
ncbi:MAG TPA: efflux RND transporter periplasmic adaptor subunit [Polyangiaceae bacterium]|nr:efflux RND transporter periplasmic adaptor subunit [Polyangiaceae bacterium]